MNREQVLALLRAHEPLLNGLGVRRLLLFGSTAGNNGGPGSDVDLLAAFDDARQLSLLDVIHVENQIADILGSPVDLLVDGTLNHHMKVLVDREAVRAF
jgi:predicted nucleotidyltransferase